MIVLGKPPISRITSLPFRVSFYHIEAPLEGRVHSRIFTAGDLGASIPAEVVHASPEETRVEIGEEAMCLGEGVFDLHLLQGHEVCATLRVMFDYRCPQASVQVHPPGNDGRDCDECD